MTWHRLSWPLFRRLPRFLLASPQPALPLPWPWSSASCSMDEAKATTGGLSRSDHPRLFTISPLERTIRHSVSGSDSISRRLCLGSSTQQAFASASASIERPATTVALETRSTGSPVRGSNTWEYHLPPICSPRCECPLVATERFFTLMNMRGSLDSESAQGATIPIVRVMLPQTRRSPPKFRSSPQTPLFSSSPTSQARPTIYPLAIPFKLIGQFEMRSALRVAGSSFHAGGAMIALTWASSSALGRRSSCAQRRQSRVKASVRGSNAPSVRSIQVSHDCSTSNSSAEMALEPGRRSCQRESSLAGSYPLKMAASRSISRRTRSSAASAAFRLSARTRSSSDVPRTFSW